MIDRRRAIARSTRLGTFVGPGICRSMTSNPAFRKSAAVKPMSRPSSRVACHIVTRANRLRRPLVPVR